MQQRQIVVSAPVETLSIDPDRVTQMRISQPGTDAVAIERVAGAWRLTSPLEYRAAEPMVRGVLRTLESLKLEDVVSTNPEKRGTFQVDSTGTRVQILEGDTQVLDLVIGKANPGYSHTYVRQEGRDEVYRAVGMLTYSFNKPVDDWRDKTILDLAPESISRVTLEYPKEKSRVVVARADTAWSVSAGDGAPGPADSTAVDQFLRGTGKLTTATFATPEEIESLDLTAPDMRLQVESDLGTETVLFVEGDEGKMYAQREGNETIFQLYKSSLTNLMKKADDLRPKT
jgi:hypothetical protein